MRSRFSPSDGLGLVLVWKFDRFARSLRQLVSALELFRKFGIDFVSATEAIDTSLPIRRVGVLNGVCFVISATRPATHEAQTASPQGKRPGSSFVRVGEGFGLSRTLVQPGRSQSNVVCRIQRRKSGS